MSMNIPPGKEEASYTYSLRVGEKLCLSMCVRTLTPFRSSRKKALPLAPCNSSR
jgi:hypothetical protein